MKNLKKKLAVCALCGTMLVGTMGITSFATDTGSKSYSNVVAQTTIHTTTNGTGKSGTFSTGARGNRDTIVRIKKADGTVVSSKTFPANTSSSWISATVGSGEIRRVTVASTSSYAVNGTLSYTSTY